MKWSNNFLLFFLIWCSVCKHHELGALDTDEWVVLLHVCALLLHQTEINSTRMWADAQRDGRPAEYRWRPLFNTTKFGWRPLLEYHAVNVAKTRKLSKFAGVSQTNETISAASGPKFTILSGHVEEVLLFNKFFSDCRYVPQLRRYSPTKLCDGAEMAIFCVLYFQRAACSTFQTCILNLH